GSGEICLLCEQSLPAPDAPPVESSLAPNAPPLPLMFVAALGMEFEVGSRSKCARVRNRASERPRSGGTDVADFIRELKRTHSCGDLTARDIGREVILFGWVHNRRDHGGAVFIDLRDRAGLTQVVFEEDAGKELQELAHELRLEYCVAVRGKVVSRGANVNPKLATGEVEVHVDKAQIFNRSETPPFLIEDRIETAEEKRLEYRYLDLRRPAVQRPLLLRSRMNAVTRRVLHERGFLELETPFLVKYTPGGARNFLVPARLQPGKFYALAESPQLFKQLFMVAGFDRYFQIVKCFRDEDLRLDRQPEFTQIDLE